MARLFISCNNRDFSLGRKLQRALQQRKHVMTLSVDAKPAGRWEGQLLRGVHNADAFISLLTENGANSSWVMGQTGMAASCEYTKQMLVLPVCPPNKIPNFVAAFQGAGLDVAGSISDSSLTRSKVRSHQARDCTAAPLRYAATSNRCAS